MGCGGLEKLTDSEHVQNKALGSQRRYLFVITVLVFTQTFSCMPSMNECFSVVQLALLIVMLPGLTACSETASAPVIMPAPATDVGRVEAWRDAERVAAADDKRTTVIGSGESMRPIYGENTVLVISRIAYDELRAGMQIAYTNKDGRRVVHVLKSQDARGWKVQGLNNVSEDRERVTPYNLLGVVYASFATDEEMK
jgi:hypothetical protein